jgi:phenylalanyl-tRNA synthetase beta chain
MRISQDWLNEFVSTPVTEELAHTFEMAGIGVESSEGGVFELEVTNNRGDWLSAIGLARESRASPTRVCALHNRMWKRPHPAQPFLSRSRAAKIVRVISRASIEKPASWPIARLDAARLTECGMRPGQHIVDVTNYVMLETGQPLHAFRRPTKSRATTS